MQSWFTLCKAGLWFSWCLHLKTVGRRGQADSTFFPKCKTTNPHSAWGNCKLINTDEWSIFEATHWFLSVPHQVKPWWMRMITGWEKPVLYSLRSQAGVVVFKRRPWVGASISFTGFVPQHRSRRSYMFNKLLCTKPQRGHLHPIKWL